MTAFLTSWRQVTSKWPRLVSTKVEEGCEEWNGLLPRTLAGGLSTLYQPLRSIDGAAAETFVNET
jgi:hypothetical protein